MTDINDNPSLVARQAIRQADRAVLATALAGDGWPYGSLVTVACDHRARPILLLSDLAEHTKNLKSEARVSLLFDATAGHDNPLTGARVTALGVISATDDTFARERFVRRHPDAADYLSFADFSLYRIEVTRAHLVAGFGAIHWFDAAEVLFPADRCPGLAERETDIIDHMNQDHADAVDLYAGRLLGLTGEGWSLTGIDPEGLDLRLGGSVARLDFDTPLASADEARGALVHLVDKARKAA